MSDIRATTARERNARAVDRLFHRSAHHAHSRDGAHNSSGGFGSSSYVDANRRSPLDVPSHIGRQLQLAGALHLPLSREEEQDLISKATSLRPRVDDAGDASKSSFALRVRIARHEVGIERPPRTPTPRHADIGREVCLTCRTSVNGICSHARQRLRNRETQQYQRNRCRQTVAQRYEQTLPRRRAVDPYWNLASGQVTSTLSRPNNYTAAKMAERYNGNWSLANAHHQQLLGGKPLITRVLGGEFYRRSVSATCGGGTTDSGCALNTHRTRNFVAENRRRACAGRATRRPGSAAPHGGGASPRL